MPDEPSTPNEGTIRTEDLIRLKHSINQRIRYRGYDAREVEQLSELSAEDYKEARKWANELIKMYHSISVFWYIAIPLILAGIYYFFPEKRENLPLTLGILAFLLLGKFAMNAGIREGYIYGFENGIETGINRALGIDEKERKDIHERSIEMERDEMVLKESNEKRNTKG